MARRSGHRALWAGLGGSVVLHLVLAWVLTANRVAFPAPRVSSGDPVLLIFREPLPETPPAVEIPPPSVPIPRPSPPEGSPDELPRSGPEPLVPPEVIPHDIPPRLINGSVIRAALEDGYPEDLPPEAADSRVLLWLFVDTGGRVTQLRLQESSGFDPLDQLATRLAPRMAYSPALHRGERVAVWVAQRIRFQPPDG